VEHIFIAALDIADSAARDAYVAEACAGDASLQAEVEELLAADAEQDFLNGPVVPDAFQAEEAGDRIGRYKLLQEIGEGGFGTVWMAEQIEPVSRRVALKIIKLGMETREVIARFEAERQALAMMDHPNIAKVFDAGATEKGRPFFVMELVRGIPITRFCDERQLGTRERLELFADVCAAINHAHQKGVIHRDIKPNNVLVTLHGEKPLPKVIDFGIAKATQGKLTDKTLFTRFEQFIGTPVYMSPEQAALSSLDVDTRTDIYGLGILLYELLTGRPPFDAKTLAAAGYDEMRRIIRDVEPPKPSSRLSTAAGNERDLLAKARHLPPEKLHRSVEPDLDWIVMKAIEKDRTRRYETANGLALDIQRFLADEPVSATPPSAAYKFRKFARRHKAALRVAAVIAALLIAATIVSSWLAVRARDAEKLANERLKNSEATAAFLEEVFQSPDPAKDARKITMVEALARAQAKLDKGLASQPELRAELQFTLGKTYRALGLFREAIEVEESCRSYYESKYGQENVQTLRAMNNLAMSYHEAGRETESARLSELVYHLRRKILGPEDPDTLMAMNNFATSLLDRNQAQDALRLLEELLPLVRKVHGPESPEVVNNLINTASAYDHLQRDREAMELKEKALALSKKVYGREDPTTLLTMSNLANSYNTSRRGPEALDLRDQVLTLRKRLLGPEHSETLQAMNNLASSYDEAGETQRALDLQEKAVRGCQDSLGAEHRITLSARHNLANFLGRTGELERELQLHQEVFDTRARVLGSDDRDTVRSMISLSTSLDRCGQPEKALALSEQTLPLVRKVFGPDSRECFQAMHDLGVSLAAAGRHKEALPLRQEALPLAQKLYGPTHQNTGEAARALAQSLHETGNEEEALKIRDIAIKILGDD
jgi:serine/threonine protein kinase/tetratricopeptide (TPR) repeat protein